MDIKSYFSNEYLKMRKRYFVILTIIGLWLVYFFWALGIGAQTVLMDSIPVWETHLISGLILGFAFAYKMKPLCRSKMEVISFFIEGGMVGVVCVLHIYAVCAYLSPGYIIKYESDYKYTSPKLISRSCDGGLSIKDIHTKKWINFCNRVPELDYEYEQGRNIVWVTARVNKFGTYIIDYKIIPKDERENFINSEFGGYMINNCKSSSTSTFI